MKIEINNYDDLTAFIKRPDVSPEDAIKTFSTAFDSTELLCVTLTDAVTGKAELNKEDVIQKISGFIDNIKEGNGLKVTVIMFN
jgi:hypothetical protein